MDGLFEALKSAEFWEKALLLILGALLTGVLVPLVKWVLDDSTFRRQKKLEAVLTRQREVIKGQTEFLTALADHLWAYNLVMLEVSFDRLVGTQDEFEEACDAFDRDSWSLLRKIRSAVGASRWFSSDETCERLTTFYEEWLIPLDGKVTAMLKTPEADAASWREHHTYVYKETSARTDALLDALAKDYGMVNAKLGASRHSKPLYRLGELFRSAPNPGPPADR